MSWRSNGGYLGPRPTGPSTAAASGWWDSRSQFRLRRDSQWPVNGDLLWSDVDLLLPMDGSNGSTTFTDLSSNGISFTANGNAQVSTAQAKFGQSALFDGNGDSLTATNSNLSLGSSAFTIEFWFRRIGNTGESGFLLQALLTSRASDSASSASYDVFLSRFGGLSTPRLAFGTPGTTYMQTAAGTVINNDQWYHVAIVRSGNTFTIYLDGVVDGTTTNSNLNDTQTTLYIGGKSGSNLGQFNGYIDDLRITKAARYTAAFTPSTVAHPVG
jgi:hypothetical protein